ncbi:MAG TPA: glucuronate isomerase [Bryobacteraceae bacterium]|nr:glucuronate isomerase [Bryobacteraceae bacterium]
MNIASIVQDVLSRTPILDMHTHLFPPSFGALPLWGIDELLRYHYLEAELFRSSDITPDQYWSMTKQQQADLIWRTLFVENAPISDAARGVVFVLHSFGLRTDAPDLTEARAFFRAQDPKSHVARVLELAGVSEVVMTNDPLDPAEAPFWLNNAARGPEFLAALRLDRILKGWAEHWSVIESQGYRVDGAASGQSTGELRRFFADWVLRMQPRYMAVSLPYTFRYPTDDVQNKLLREAVLPACREAAIPIALMIGPAYQVNPAIRLAGDSTGKADIRTVEAICRDHPCNRFFVTLLSRESQHELCVAARKFSNLMPFGCWWFLNNSSIVDEITRERVEMLGATMIPQHSDARVLEHIIYKWRNSRRVIGQVLADAYQLMADDGRAPKPQEIERDIRRMMRGNFERWTRLERARGSREAGGR